MDSISDKKSIRKPKVAFVLGGPGSGKGTLCQRLAEKYNVKHLSVGALLRSLGSSGSEDGREIQNIINEGKIVPPIDTIHVLQNAMRNHNNNIFLIDGFPRNEENRVAFENITGIVPEFVFFLDCPEQEMERRLLARNQNRPDDNMQAVRKRFKVFMESTVPVVEHYEAIGKLHKINAAKSAEEVENRALPYMMPLIHYDLLEVSAELLHAIDRGDFTTYQRLCDAELTAFEPEAQGHLVEGLDFHQFYFKQNKQSELAELSPSQSTISSPKVKVLNDIWIVTYTRLQQKQGLPFIGMVDAYNETRIWRRQKGYEGAWEWKNVHFHRSKAPVNRAFQFSIHEDKHRHLEIS